jgi:hypothetical protein
MSFDTPPYVLECLTLVGSGKAVGYLPLRTVKHVLGLEVEEVISDATDRGLKAISIGPRHCCIKSGALYVFDPDALEELLRSASDILNSVGSPTDPEMFVRFIARNWFEPDHPIMPIIRAAFADGVKAA